MPLFRSPTRRAPTSWTTSPSSTVRAGCPSHGSGSDACGRSCAGAESAPPPARPGDLLHEPAACRHGRHDRQRGAAVDPQGPARVAVGSAVDYRRLHPGAGELADVVRVHGRPARATADVSDRTGPLHHRLAAVQPGTRSWLIAFRMVQAIGASMLNPV